MKSIVSQRPGAQIKTRDAKFWINIMLPLLLVLPGRIDLVGDRMRPAGLSKQLYSFDDVQAQTPLSRLFVTPDYWPLASQLSAR